MPATYESAVRLSKALDKKLKERPTESVGLVGGSFTLKQLHSAANTGSQVPKDTGDGAGAGGSGSDGDSKKKSGSKATVPALRKMITAVKGETSVPEGMSGSKITLQTELRNLLTGYVPYQELVSVMMAYNKNVERFWRDIDTNENYSESARKTYKADAVKKRLFYSSWNDARRTTGVKEVPERPAWWKSIPKETRREATKAALDGDYVAGRMTDTSDSEQDTRKTEREAKGTTKKRISSYEAALATSANDSKREGKAKAERKERRTRAQERAQVEDVVEGIVSQVVAQSKATAEAEAITATAGQMVDQAVQRSIQSLSADRSRAEATAAAVSEEMGDGNLGPMDTVDSSGSSDPDPYDYTQLPAPLSGSESDAALFNGATLDSDLSDWSTSGGEFSHDEEAIEQFLRDRIDEQMALTSEGEPDSMDEDMSYLIRRAPAYVRRDMRRARSEMRRGATIDDPMGFNTDAARQFFGVTGVPSRGRDPRGMMTEPAGAGAGRRGPVMSIRRDDGNDGDVEDFDSDYTLTDDDRDTMPQSGPVLGPRARVPPPQQAAPQQAAPQQAAAVPEPNPDGSPVVPICRPPGPNTGGMDTVPDVKRRITEMHSMYDKYVVTIKAMRDESMKVMKSVNLSELLAYWIKLEDKLKAYFWRPAARTEPAASQGPAPAGMQSAVLVSADSFLASYFMRNGGGGGGGDGGGGGGGGGGGDSSSDDAMPEWPSSDASSSSDSGGGGLLNVRYDSMGPGGPATSAQVTGHDSHRQSSQSQRGVASLPLNTRVNVPNQGGLNDRTVTGTDANGKRVQFILPTNGNVQHSGIAAQRGIGIPELALRGPPTFGQVRHVSGAGRPSSFVISPSLDETTRRTVPQTAGYIQDATLRNSWNSPHVLGGGAGQVVKRYPDELRLR